MGISSGKIQKNIICEKLEKNSVLYEELGGNIRDSGNMIRKKLEECSHISEYSILGVLVEYSEFGEHCSEKNWKI